MTTTLYLPASGTPPLASLAVDTNWELTNSLVRLPTLTDKSNTALATDTRTWPATSTQQWCWWQFQSRPLATAYDWTTADTVSMVIGKCAETTTSGDTHLAYVVWVVSGDGSTIRGVIGLYHATSTEYPLVASAATRIHSARVDGATVFSSQVGDRIIVEIGLHGVTPAAESIQMRKGDPSATADFALTAGLTTDLVPWVRLSRTVVFGFSDSDTEVASAADNQSATQLTLSAISEVVTADDIKDGLRTTADSITEATSATEISNAEFPFTPPLEAEIAEVVSATDSQEGLRFTTSTLTEVTSAAETSDGLRITASAITEIASTNDTPDGLRNTSSAIAEPVSASDSQNTLAVTIASITEAVSGVDVANGLVAATASIGEPSSAADIQAASSNTQAAIAETVNAQETSSGFVVTVASITEEVNSTETSNGLRVTSAGIAEDCSAQDVQDTGEGQEYTATITETVNSLESSSGSLVTLAAFVEVSPATDLSDGSLTRSANCVEASSTEDISDGSFTYAANIVEAGFAEDVSNGLFLPTDKGLLFIESYICGISMIDSRDEKIAEINRFSTKSAEIDRKYTK